MKLRTTRRSFWGQLSWRRVFLFGERNLRTFLFPSSFHLFHFRHTAGVLLMLADWSGLALNTSLIDFLGFWWTIRMPPSLPLLQWRASDYAGHWTEPWYTRQDPTRNGHSAVGKKRQALVLHMTLRSSRSFQIKDSCLWELALLSILEMSLLVNQGSLRFGLRLAFQFTCWKIESRYFLYNIFCLWFTLPLLLPVPPHFPSHIDPHLLCLFLENKKLSEE